MASIAARTAAVVVGRGMSAGAGGLATATPLHAAAAVGVRAMSTNIAMARQGLQNAHAICFDVDSTVTEEEGIDELARFAGVYEEVKALTDGAMGDGDDFRKALEERLRLINPTVEMVRAFLEKHPATLSPGLADFVSELRKRDTDVFLVSGGFTQLIAPVAAKIDVPMESHVFANTILFDDAGNYAGFDKTAFTSQSGGKPKAVQHIMDTHGYKTIVAIGDGATDMEARPPALAFIGYGGVVSRPKVVAGADWFVKDFQDLIDALDS